MSQTVPTVFLYLLGPPRIEREGRPAVLKYNRARALIAYLALEPGFHTRDSLAELFWPDEATAQGRDKLKRMVFELREALGESCIEGDRYVVRLAPLSTVWVDAIAFEADTDPVITALAPNEAPAVEQRAARTTVAWRNVLDRCERAVALYRGPLLQGLRIDDAPDFESWLEGQREAYVRRLVLSLSRLARGRAQGGRTAEAIRHAHHLVEVAPYHEPGWQQLIELLMRDGRRDAALYELDRCRRALARELDAEPQAETLALVEKLTSEPVIRPVQTDQEGSQPLQPGVRNHARPARPASSRHAANSDDGPRDDPDPDPDADADADEPAMSSSPSLASVPRAHARLAMGVAHLVHGRLNKAMAAFDATLGSQPDHVIDLTFGTDARAMALSLLSVTHWRAGHQGTAMEASTDALKRARRVGDPHSLAHALLTAGVLCELSGESERTLEHTSALLELADAHRLPNWRLAVTALSGRAIATMGDPAGLHDAQAAEQAFNASMGSVGAMLLALLRERD